MQAVVETRGWLDRVVIDDDRLRADGWAVSIGAGPVDGFTVASGGRALRIGALEMGLPSGDVQAAHPGIDGVAQCRFRFDCVLDRDARAVVGERLLEVRPIVGGHVGRLMCSVPAPSLPVPPAEFVGPIGGGSVTALAFHFLPLFVDLGGLSRTARVLDAGCGPGRMAYGLAYYLDARGSYEGFDIVPEWIEWAQREIGGRRSNFRFDWAGIHNLMYNPRGTVEAAEFEFPQANDSIDFAFLTSVFTHMRWREVSHYLAELHRVLQTGGRCFCTWFLLNAESRSLVEAKRSSRDMRFPLDHDCFTANAEVPEEAIGFPEPALAGLIEEHGFRLVSRSYGNWCGRTLITSPTDLLTYQDVLVLQKV